ncbi:NADH-dependent dehydrogenase [Lunatimonas lonarensis]|uniref:NADH-dependent dehydrogenase n=1 Tax=Lunatimonas lonarensis TaxID=1232681 RepID=R7ZLW6_9BACT|nr:Gfo/Idh/MocA family oxidoreductase [Lunatimonas lonarensis]EON75077.1 NADH-dependent dehydrogenase [Lunatimonas lonarensis]
MTQLLSSLLLLLTLGTAFAQERQKVKLAVVGLTHSHVHWILGRADKGDVEIVAIVEPNRDLASRLMGSYKLPMSLHVNSMEEMFDKVTPEGVTAFGSIYEHLEVVQACAPRGVHVMVEKPLAVSTAHANEMARLAKAHDILLITNYETTWYASNQEVYRQVHEEKAIGELRRVIINDGHEGPKEIGVNPEFLDWLADPVQNGGGAVIDFGCYGANLLTWLMQGERPISVTAELKQIKTDTYPKVDDDATILVQYPRTKGVIQASWNWPFSRKDLEAYGETGYLIARDGTRLSSRLPGQRQESDTKLAPRPYPYDDPFSFFAGLIRKEISMQPYDLSSLENNLIVVEILEAAIQSDREGRRVLVEK